MIEFCSRTVRLSLRSDQNAFRIGTVRVRDSGRFRFEWVPRRAKVGAGRWRLVARMRCESGKDGSPVPAAPVRGAADPRLARGRDLAVVAGRLPRAAVDQAIAATSTPRATSRATAIAS